MLKVKHERTADCVVAGFVRTRPVTTRSAPCCLGCTSQMAGWQASAWWARSRWLPGGRCARKLDPLITTFDGHPWNWAAAQETTGGTRTPRSSEYSRWNVGKDLSFTPLRPERVLEVRYDHMEGPRFRHTAQFVRWRPDRSPSSCTFAQLEEPVSFNLAEILRQDGPA